MASYAEIKKRVSGGAGIKQSDQQSESKYQKIKKQVNSGYLKFDGVDDDYISSFLKDSDDFIKNTQNQLQGADWNSHSARYDTWAAQRDNMSSRADTIRSYLNANKSRIDEESYNGIMSYLGKYAEMERAALTDWNDAKSYFSQWETEKDYNDAQAAWQDRLEKLDFDLDAGQVELDELKTNFDNYSKVKKERDSQYNYYVDFYQRAGYLPDGTTDVNGDGRVDAKDAALKHKKVVELDSQLAQFGDMSGAESTISQKTQYLNQAKKLQTEQKLVTDAQSDSNFKLYSDIGLNLKNPEDIEKVPSTWFQDGESVANPVTMSRENADYIAIMEGNGGSVAEYGLKSIYRYMTNDEVAIYNYYLGKGDKAKADEYLASIEDSLNSKHGHVVYNNVKDSFFGTALLSIGAGLDQVKSGMQGLGDMVTGSEVGAVSPWQYASAEVKENLLDEDGGWTLGSVGYDLLNTTAHMAPTLLAGAVNPILGAATLGASAMGNSYADAIREGYDKDQARGYAVLTGLSEATLQYALGGIGKLGGKLSGGAISKLSNAVVSKVKSGLGKALTSGGIKLAGSMVSEFGEEYLQEVLTPVFKNIAFNTNEDVELFSSDALYAGVLGALSAGLLEGAGTVGGEISTYQAGKNVIREGKVQDLANFGKTYSPETMAYEIASKVDENTDAYTLGQLVREVGADSLSQTNMDDIQNSLVEKNVAPEDAKKIAKWLNKVVEGAVLTKSQQVALENNPVISEVYRDVILNPQSTVSQRTQEATGSSIALRALAEEMARVKQKEQEKAKIEQIKFERKFSPAQNRQLDQMVADASETIAQKMAEEQFGVSEDASGTDEGKTVNTKTGEYVDVVSISSAKGGDMMLKVKKSDGSVEDVSAKNLSFGNRNDYVLYSMVMDMGVSADTAESIIKTFDPADGVSVSKYALGMRDAYKYGKLGIPAQEMSQGAFTAMLTEAQRSHAYKLGKFDAKAEVSKNQKNVTELRKKAADTKGKDTKKKGSVKLDGVKSGLTGIRKVSVDVLEKLAESLGVDFVIFESYKEGKNFYYKDKNGEVKPAPNGLYDPSTGTIYIDIHAGITGEGTILFTAAHELTHHIKRWSPEKFKVLADFLMEQYGKKGQSVDALVKAQIAKAAKHDRVLSYEEAFEEVVADSMETMLADGNVAQKLALLKAKDKSLFERIKAFFDDLVKKIREVYAGKSPDSPEGQMVAEMKDSIERLQELFAEGLADASENYQASEQVLAESGIAVDPETDAGSIFSVRDVLNDTDRQKVAKALAERFSVTVDEAMNWLTAETSLASLILNPKYSAYLDYEADASETAIKTNSDYPQGTVDFSNICPKRREFTQVMNSVLRNFPHHVFAATDLAKIRTIMGEEGLTLPCHICYVEDRRQLDTIVAQDFLNGLKLYREGSKTRPDGKPFNANQLKGLKLIDGDTYVPTIYELVTLEGRNSLKAKNPNMEAAWVKYNNARGMQSIRLLTNEAEYKRHILKYSKTTVKAKNDNGGLRIYSFSDAEMFHLIDIIQVITDSATVGLCLQGYTKINEYAKAVKDTGEKLNRSLIPKGELGYHIEDGKIVLDYDTVEGIDINSKDFFDNRDNPDVGNIVIGINDTQIRAAMVSDFIDQIIPFHTGQSDEVLGEKGIASWDNYKTFQKEKDLATGNASDHQINIYTEVIQAAAAEGNPIQNKRQFVEKFLAVCKENNLQPRFSQFLNTDAQGNYIYTEGYHKFLVDFKTFAQTEVGEYLPQMPVKPIFDDAYITQLLKDYVKEQQAKDAEVAKSMPKVIERITNEIIKADSAHDILYSDRYIEAETNSEILSMVERVERGEFKANEKVYLGIVTETIAEQIHELTGISVDGYKVAIEARQIEHILKDHGKQGAADKSMSDYSNIAKMEYALNAPDDISAAGKTKAYTYMVNGRNKTADTILYEKSIGEKSYYVVQAVPDTKAKTLYIVTAFIGKKGYKKEASQLINAKSLDATAKTGSASASANMIPQESDSVKYSDRDSEGNVLSDGQKEFFKDSKVRDKEGNLLVVYHGTPKKFTTFRQGVAAGWGRGIYFTDNVEATKEFGDNIVKAYLNITNPYYPDKMDYYKIGAENTKAYRDFDRQQWEKWSSFEYDTYEEYKDDGMGVDMYEIYEEEIEVFNKILRELGYDGIIANGSNNIDGLEIVAFKENQPKLTTNINPTTDPDIRYSDRDPDAVSTRNLLANSLESAAQNDIERNKLRLYKEKIDLIEAEEKKLTDLRAEIKELSFAKGPRDSAKIRALQDEATRTANRINTYDKQLLTLEASKPLQNILQHEKDRAMKRQKQKDAENLRAYKEKAAATQRELLTRYQESRKNAVEGRHKTEMRHKIKSVVSELNKLLLNGTKERNVKLGLQPAVAAALEAVNMDTVAADERIATIEAKIAKAKDPDVVEALTKTRDNIMAQGDVMASRLEALRRAYADIKASSDNIPEHYKSEAALIADKVDSVMQKVGQTPLRNMNLSQLESVYELYKMVLTTVRNTNALFRQGKLEDLQNNVSEIMAEVSALPKLKEERLRLGGVVNSFSWNEMIPVYAFERIGSKTFSKFFWEVVKAQNTFATDINEAKEFSSAARKKYGYDKWDTAKVHEFKLSDGRTFRLTLKHMMSIYAYSKREQALEHMRKGGFFFNDKETFRKKGGVLSFVKSNEEGYYVDEKVLSSIVGAMTQEQVDYVDAMQEYLTKMGEKGNEVSRVLWGIDIFKEKVYFPLKSSKDFIFQANQTAQEASLKNDGMTKEVKPGASNPIILEAFDDVWANHVNRMSQYHSFVLPIENLNKIHNYGSWAGTASVSVSTMLAARHGTAVNDYLSDFIKDLNGASSSQGASNPFFSMLSKFKKTAVAASASVVVQQPTAILRAMAVMDAKYFVGHKSKKTQPTNWSELKKYAPIAIIKEIGGFDAGAGRQATQWLNEDTVRGTEKVMNKIDDVSMKGAALGDQIGWGAIWNAVKREVRDTTDLKEGSEEFLQKAGERFTEVIVLTQVYDSTLSRSGYMRSKHDSVKMLTSFMGEPTVSINMMFNATVQAKRGNITKRKATRILSAVYASVVAASVAASLVYALRDDDEDESYLEKFAEALGGKLLGDINPLNMLPAVRDIFSILEGWEVERTDVAIFQDIKSAFDSLDSENKSAWRKVEDFAGAIASLFGLPLKNVLRTGREIYNGINDIFDGISPSGVGDAFVRGIAGEKKDKDKALYTAIVEGDQTRLDIYRKGYKDDKAYEMAVRDALRKNDPRILVAALARKSGNTEKYASLVREIVKEGHFSQDTVVKAVNNALTKLSKGEETDEEKEDENKASSIYYSSDLNKALDDGDTHEALTIIDDMVKVKTENYVNDGEKEKDAEAKAKASVKSSITSYWKPLYLAAYERGDTAEMARIRNLLYSTKLYGTANEVVKTAQNWVKNSK